MLVKRHIVDPVPEEGTITLDTETGIITIVGQRLNDCIPASVACFHIGQMPKLARAIEDLWQQR